MKVSVVIAAVSGDRVTDRCIESVKRFAAGREIEWILMKGDPKSIFRLRAEGMLRASGNRIAVLGDRYEVTPSWIERLWAGETAEVEVGPIDAAQNLSYWGWCVYLSEYVHVAPPAATGFAHHPKQMPGGNAIYPASVIRREPPQSSDTEWIFHTRLRKAGIPVAIRPELDVRFSSPPRPGEYFAERFWLSRTIGASGGVPKLLFAPLLPLLLMARIALASMKKPRLLFRFVASAPVIFVLSAIQAAGEFTGSLGGKPK